MPTPTDLCPEWISLVHEDPKKRDGSSWVVKCQAQRGHRELCGHEGLLVWPPEMTYRNKGGVDAPVHQ